MKGKILGALGTVGAFLSMGVGKAFAQTPTVATVPTEMTQLAVNGVASVQEGFFSVVGLIWPYVLILILGFLAIRYGMSMIFRRGA